MTYLLDTNIISEVRKGDRCDQNVAAWYASITDSDLYLSVLVLGEIRKGIEQIRYRDPAQASALETWLNLVVNAFGKRVLSVDRAVADAWGRMAAIRPIPAIDGLLAATAKVNRLVLVTRDADGVSGLGAEVLNPF
jgi:predicted nucleic acid-binding protein